MTLGRVDWAMNVLPTNVTPLDDWPVTSASVAWTHLQGTPGWQMGLSGSVA